MSLLRSKVSLALGVSSILVATAATAQPVGGDRAIELGSQGIELYKAQKWSECVAKFEAASALVHSPVFELYRARCLRGDGRLLKARALFESVSREQIAADAPAPWKTAQADAKADLAAIQKEVPSVVVRLVDDDAEPVTLDGQAAKPGEVELDPGLHKITFVRRGKTETMTFEIARGERGKVVPEAAPGPRDAGRIVTPPDNGPGVKLVPPPPTSEGSSGSVVAGAVLTAVGGAALVVGGIFGGLAISKYGEIEDVCGPSLRCPPSRLDDMQDLRGEADTIADASTGLLISGGVVAAVGIVLLIVQPGGGDTASSPPWVVRF